MCQSRLPRLGGRSYSSRFAEPNCLTVPIFPAKCPVDASAKDWIEDSLHLLGSEFGREVLNDRPIVEPTDKFFPAAYSATIDGADMLLRQTANFIDADLALIRDMLRHVCC